MQIVVIGGTQAAIKGTAQEIEAFLKKTGAVKVEHTGAVTKYVTQDKRIRVAK